MRATSLVELPTQKPPRVRDEASVPYDIYNSKRVLDAKSRLRNVTVNGKKHLVVLRRKVVEAEKALLVAKVNFNEASQALAFGIDVGMSPMQMARAEYNKAKADLAKLRKNRRVIDRKILAAKEIHALSKWQKVNEANSVYILDFRGKAFTTCQKASALLYAMETFSKNL